MCSRKTNMWFSRSNHLRPSHQYFNVKGNVALSKALPTLSLANIAVNQVAKYKG